MYARHVVEKRLSNIFRDHLHRDYVSELLDQYFRNIVDVAQLAFLVKQLAAFNPLQRLPLHNSLTPLIALPEQLRTDEQISR